MRCQASARSAPDNWAAVTLTFRPPISICAWSGCAARLWYQAGFFALPPNEATISQASSPSGNEPSKVSRGCPVLAPVVVSTSVFCPGTAPPLLLRRCRLIICLLSHFATGLPTPGMR